MFHFLVPEDGDRTSDMLPIYVTFNPYNGQTSQESSAKITGKDIIIIILWLYSPLRLWPLFQFFHPIYSR